MRTMRHAALAILCLGFTAHETWADPAQADDVEATAPPAGRAAGPGPAPAVASADLPPAGRGDIEDPYARHVTRGNSVRFGTAVGFLYGEPVEASALGGFVAFGHRLDRLTLEAEFTALALHAPGGLYDHRIGDGERLAAVARYDVVRLGPDKVGANSMLALYVEGGAGVAWNHWYRPGASDPARIVPPDSKRVEGQAGFGLLLDHRLQEPEHISRIGWYLGWRIALTPHDAEPATVCRGVVCRTEVQMPAARDDNRIVDRSMLFQSSFLVTW